MSGEELTSEPKASTPGEVLAQARESLGVTQREVSDALNLPISTIAAIENDDKSSLPSHVFTRGYVRAYAKLLEVDPDPLVAALSQDHQNADGVKTQAHEPRSYTRGRALKALASAEALKDPRNILIAVVSVLVVAVAVWLILPDDEGSQQLDAQAVQAEAGAPSDPAGSSAGDQSRLSPAEDGPPMEGETVQEPAVEERIAQPAQVDGLTDDGITLHRLTNSGADRLSLLFVEECWVEIKDPQDNVLFGELGQIGQRMEFVGAGPFRVLLGYAPGVELKFNAEPVALAPHTRNNVANLVLGQ